MRLNVLRGFLGGHGGRHYGSMELYAHPLLHRQREVSIMSMSLLSVKAMGDVERIMVSD